MRLIRISLLTVCFCLFLTVFSEAQNLPKISYSEVADSAIAPVTIRFDDQSITNFDLINKKTKQHTIIEVPKGAAFVIIKPTLEKGKNNFLIDVYKGEDRVHYANDIQFQIELIDTVAAVPAPQDHIKPIPTPTPNDENLGEPIGDYSLLNSRAVIGFEQIGASAANSEQHPFIDFFFHAPLSTSLYVDANDPKKTKQRRADLSIWGDLRFSTTAVQNVAQLPNFTPAAFGTSFIQGTDVGKVNDLVQSFDFLIGLEKEILPLGTPFKGLFANNRTSLSLIMSGGAINPLSSNKTAQTFKIPKIGTEIDPAFLKLFPEAAGKTNVAFVSPERARFFRQFYAGFRLKTYFYSKDKSLDYFPGMFDVTFGQNEAITNHLKGVILRLDGSTPFPLIKSDYVYLYASAQLRLGRNVNSPTVPFFLTPADASILTSTDTVIIPIDRSPYLRSNRDVYKIGVGIDLLRLFNKDKKAAEPTPTPSPTPASNE